MIRKIMKDPMFLMRKAEPCTIADLAVGEDLKDTLISVGQDACVGMAANMIGVNKNIIVFYDGDDIIVAYNPEIIKFSGKVYEAEEGCLSLAGVRKAKRYEKVKLSYLEPGFKKKIKTFSGFTAQIIQHEIDHTNGILI